MNGKLENILELIDSEEDLPRNINNNLKNGKIRLIIAVDESNDDLQRIMNFINIHTDLDIRLIEIAKYDNGNFLIPIPVNVNNNFELIGNNTQRNNFGKIGKQQDSESEIVFREIIEKYNTICQSKYKTTGNNNRYRQIRMPNWPRSLHYEFIIRKNSMLGIDLHNESDLIQVNNVTKEYDQIKIENYTIQYVINKGIHGHLKIEVPNTEDINKIKLIMEKLIEMTKEKIEKVIGSAKTSA